MFTTFVRNARQSIHIKCSRQSCVGHNQILEQKEAKRRSERKEREKNMRNITIYLRFGGNYFNDFLPPWIFFRLQTRRRRKSVSLRWCVTYRSGKILPEIPGRRYGARVRPTTCGINFFLFSHCNAHILAIFWYIHFRHTRIAINDREQSELQCMRIVCADSSSPPYFHLNETRSKDVKTNVYFYEFTLKIMRGYFATTHNVCARWLVAVLALHCLLQIYLYLCDARCSLATAPEPVYLVLAVSLFHFASRCDYVSSLNEIKMCAIASAQLQLAAQRRSNNCIVGRTWGFVIGPLMMMIIDDDDRSHSQAHAQSAPSFLAERDGSRIPNNMLSSGKSKSNRARQNRMNNNMKFFFLHFLNT